MKNTACNFRMLTLESLRLSNGRRVLRYFEI